MRAIAAVLLGGAILQACSIDVQTNPNAMTAPMSAEDVAREIDVARASTPLPAGADWKVVELDPTAAYGPLSGLSIVEFQALCAWLAEAQAAFASGDDVALSNARGVIATIPGWRSFSDPTVTVPDFRSTIGRIVDAALHDDVRTVEQFQRANCTE